MSKGNEPIDDSYFANLLKMGKERSNTVNVVPVQKKDILEKSLRKKTED